MTTLVLTAGTITKKRTQHNYTPHALVALELKKKIVDTAKYNEKGGFQFCPSCKEIVNVSNKKHT